MEAFVLQLQPEQVFPVDPAADRVRCLAVGRSANCITDTTASIPGARPGPPREGKAAAKSVS
jgi:hypothetical protein